MASGDWSMVQHEPSWQTNTSFSPLPSRWDFNFQSDELLDDSPDSNLFHWSSASINSKGNGWMRGNLLYNHQCSSLDGAGMFFSGSPDLSPRPQWTPPAIQEISAEDYATAPGRGQALAALRKPPSKAAMEGTSRNPESRRSTSSCSDSSESEPTFKSCLSSHRTITGRRSFLSKPIHPLFFPTQAPRDTSQTQSSGPSESDADSTQGDSRCLSSASSSIDFSGISVLFESEKLGRLQISSDDFRCGLCEKFLSQRSPWSSRRIVRSGDMPVASVLSCHHVFHAECLEQAIPKALKSDPPCPLCIKLEGGSSAELQTFPRLKNSFPGLRISSEYGPSRPRGYMPMADCLEGASHPPRQNTMFLLNRHQVKKNLSLKSSSGKEFPGKLRKSGTCSSKSTNLGPVGSSTTIT